MNNNTIYVGMDVHKTNFTLCSYNPVNETYFAEITLEPDYKQLIKYIDNLKKELNDVSFVLGYEAGSLGYSLYRQLTSENLQCVILAPSTMSKSTKDTTKKTDRRDARMISKCLAFGLYKPVYVPDEKDNEVKEYIRCRDDIKAELKRIKQELLAFLLRHGYIYTETKNKWTPSFFTWLNKLTISDKLKEVLDEYLEEYRRLTDKLERMDNTIYQTAHSERYDENVSKLICLKGIKEHTALAFIVEIGDFERFKDAKSFNAYLGLTPREHSSSDKRQLGSITKDGNSHLRKLLIEAAQTYTKGSIGYKSKALKQRQERCDEKTINYADKAIVRLQKRYYHLTSENKQSNIAKVAIARELSSFIWGMMTNHLD